MGKVTSKRKQLSKNEREELLATLKHRFEANMSRHTGLEWNTVVSRREARPDKLWSLSEMERSGGEPDVVSIDKASGEVMFVDCAAESPKGRRSLCYDAKALASRKENKPKDSAVNSADTMGIEMLSEEEYRSLQQLGEFDLKTSSWVKTPDDIRALGGAIFCDRRYNTVFTYHNGAEAYYGARGFRGSLRV